MAPCMSQFGKPNKGSTCTKALLIQERRVNNWTCLRKFRSYWYEHIHNKIFYTTKKGFWKSFIYKYFPPEIDHFQDIRKNLKFTLCSVYRTTPMVKILDTQNRSNFSRLIYVLRVYDINFDRLLVEKGYKLYINIVALSAF